MPRDRKKKNRISLCKFLKSEVTRSYFLQQYEERYEFKREQIYTFMKIPREVEKLIGYGFFQVVDAFLFIFTFLPLRFVLAVWAFLTRPLLIAVGLRRQQGDGHWLKPSEIIDMMKGLIIIITCFFLSYIDTSMLYHVVKSQSIIKLYMFYNMLEVGDKLMSSFGQDTLDALHWTATEPRKKKRQHLGTLPHFFLATVYVFLHGILILFQTTVLNVAINSSNKALLTVMMSNNFVELKGSVFKKFDRNNLLQVACSDIRERFHYCVLLLLVTVQTMKEFGWNENQLWVLLPDCILVLVAELFVDWVKHAFITRFNEIPVEIYREYTLTLAYDLISSKQKYAFSDHSDMVSHRMGFISLPLAALTARILLQSVRLTGTGAWLLVAAAYLALATFRVLNTIVILGKACDLIEAESAPPPSTVASPASAAAAVAEVRSRCVSECDPAADSSLTEPYNVFREFSPPATAATGEEPDCSCAHGDGRCESPAAPTPVSTVGT
ncbi:protein TAPT1 homolog [Pollicipes pollicipes]|uniref:protein TAPT1 homolog n=1 Tax=Pollicipes pollicipes TaxID=41117 RepID=UPI0018850B34|nr:protein TAPT1 homolog [Pollicipes pollicipes]XP_037083216.1 protein TAPT1 homolog [Pollicipes pollicipes]XP_037083218.1 protein TAPT1 homolog [Pollicipes pollicipes]XP_037083219.1 protein TAPT1 homolog [Pollicipes pollicipes]